MANRAPDWFRQAERDLQHAVDSERDGQHEWACFAAQQAAEKAVKALHLHVGQEAWGHVVAKLLTELPGHVAPPPQLVDKAKVLDNFYLPNPVRKRSSRRRAVRALPPAPKQGGDRLCP